MSNMSTFKIIVTAIFALCFVAGIAIFALSKSSSSEQTYDLTVWGTVSSDTFLASYNNSSLKTNKQMKVNYVKKDPSTFDADFVEALAEGKGPDLVILRDDSIYKQRNKLFVIPYQNYSVRDFKDRFIQEGELFLAQDGVVAVPFIVDPMVMYWNRDMFSNAQIPQPPQYWDQVAPIIDKITRRDSSGNDV